MERSALGFLTRAEGSPVVYVLKAVAITLPAALLVAALTSVMFPEAPQPDFEGPSPLFVLLAVVVFSPLAETLLLWGTLVITRQLLRNDLFAAIAAALAWAVLHSLSAPLWGFAIFIPFLVFSIAFITWQTRSNLHAFLVTAGLHALHNLLPAILVAYVPGA